MKHVQPLSHLCYSAHYFFSSNWTAFLNPKLCEGCTDIKLEFVYSGSPLMSFEILYYVHYVWHESKQKMSLLQQVKQGICYQKCWL